MKYKNRNIIKKKLKLHKIFIEGTEKNITITAIGDIFMNINSVKKQQLIYSPLMVYFKKNNHSCNKY
ncbi:putative transcriptional regulator [Buchnera aphidicola (Cinara tujafilina)]|uniref:Putative transcriptional regulator n=1 Tax=Buchnera aphidicola (Cinara tujafilina) TaxID=261317 RepID=F7WZH0_9GAMM|nr:transcriptional regulator [Buchnera aphidicola]AEH39832.1 putative transcriptional regulator [Buchnera aphidicola (Cinara tujafilina)]